LKILYRQVFVKGFKRGVSPSYFFFPLSFQERGSGGEVKGWLTGSDFIDGYPLCYNRFIALGARI
jgi:hypothetical protein